MYIRLSGGVKDCCAVFNLNGNVINSELYHLNILPPFSAP